MYPLWRSIIVVLSIMITKNCYGKKILLLAPVAPASHENVFNSVAEVLISKGHAVTMVSPGYKKVDNVTYISTMSLTNTVRSNYLSKGISKLFDQSGYLVQLSVLMSVSLNMESDLAAFCLNDSVIQSLYFLPARSYDLVITNARGNLCVAPLAYLLQAPLVFLSPSGLFHHTHALLGNPNLPAINPSYYLGVTDDMNFSERFMNAIGLWIPYIIMSQITFPKIDKMISKTAPVRVPSIESILMDARLVFLNTHHSVNFPRSFLPNMIEIGGIHIRPPMQLPEDIENFISQGKNGFIFFSLGSTSPGHLIPEAKRASFLSAFSELPYQVFWKFDKPELLANVPDNVKIAPWFPQTDLLGHPQIKAFITQGGLLSIQEAVYNSVPILGIPIFGDQPSNVRQACTKGYGLSLLWSEINKETLKRSISELISNPLYKNSAVKFSKIFRKRQNDPEELVAFWVDYILENNGAVFLGSPARFLNFFQYHMLDIYIFLFLFVYILYKLPVLLLRRIFRKKELIDLNKKNE